jgi:Tol biopolymer transport system component/DNA-binding winged helix-turn-helix (wHTH) protein
MNNRLSTLYEFGKFRLDAAEHLLLRDGKAVQLTPKAFQTLLVLVRNGGRLVEKDELMRQVWADAFVEEANLARNIWALRRALGDDEDEHCYIETVPKLGYRFVAPVTELSDEAVDLQVHRHFRAQIVTEELDTSSPEAVSTAPRDVEHAPQPVTAARYRRRVLAIGSVTLLAAVGLAGFIFRDRFRSGRLAVPFSMENIRPKRITHTGRASGAVISPDGQFVVYETPDDESKPSLWLRHAGSDDAVRILPSLRENVWGFAISHDANWLYFVQASRDAPLKGGTIYRMPLFGGIPHKLTETVYSIVSLSPDDQRLVFDRFTSPGCELVTASAIDGGDERVIARSGSARDFLNPRWSPDGARILFFNIEERGGATYWSLAEMPARGGESRVVLPPQQERIWFMDWANNGRGIVVNARDPDTRLPQLYYLPYPDGEMSRITNDLFEYFGVSVGANSIITARTDRESKMWLAPWPDPVQPDQPKQVTGDNVGDNLSWTSDGRIVYDTSDDGRYQIWIMDSNGQGRQRLSPNNADERLPDVSPDGRHIAFISNRGGGSALWFMDTDGRNARQLTQSIGGVWMPRFAPDGQSIFFEIDRGAQVVLARVSVDGGEPAVVADDFNSESFYDISPDGQRLAYSWHDKQKQQTRVVVRQIYGNADATYLDIAPGYFLRWTPDGKGLAYAGSGQDDMPGEALVVQPLGGGRPKVINLGRDDLLYCVAWSRDGKQLAFAHGRFLRDIIWLTRDKAQP